MNPLVKPEILSYIGLVLVPVLWKLLQFAVTIHQFPGQEQLFVSQQKHGVDIQKHFLPNVQSWSKNPAITTGGRTTDKPRIAVSRIHLSASTLTNPNNLPTPMELSDSQQKTSL